MKKSILLFVSFAMAICMQAQPSHKFLEKQLDKRSDCKSVAITKKNGDATSIGSRAFNGCKGIKSIKYRGSESQWENICKGNRWDQDMGKCVVNYGCNE